MTRANIKLPEDEFETHNTRRKELGLSWAEYLDSNAPELREREVEAQERQADALEAIAGALLMDQSDDRQLNPEALLEEARYHYEPDKPQL